MINIKDDYRRCDNTINEKARKLNVSSKKKFTIVEGLKFW